MISSVANQSFTTADGPTAISNSTITNRGYLTTGTVFNAASNIRVRIPSTFDMVWGSGDTTATITGEATTKIYSNESTQTILCGAPPCSATVTYEDMNRTVVIWVGTDFAASDTLTIANLSFDPGTTIESVDNLELEVLNDGVVQDEDDKTIEVGA